MTPANTGGGRRRVAGERGRGRATAPPAGRTDDAQTEAPRSTRAVPLVLPPEPSRPARPSLTKGSTARPASTRAPGASGAVDRSDPFAHPSAPAGPRASGLYVGLLAALVVLTVAVVTAAAVVLVVDRRQQQLSDARTAATEAARSAAEVVLAYDYETLDDDFAAAQAVSTGAFKEEYAETSENAIRSVATETQAQVSAEPLSAGVVSATRDRVVVLLFVDQTTLSNRLDQPQTDQNRVRFTMERTTVDGADRWLVSEVDAL